MEELLKTLAGSTPLAAVLLYMWKLERDERIESRRENRELTERVLKGLNDAVMAIQALTQKLP